MHCAHDGIGRKRTTYLGLQHISATRWRTTAPAMPAALCNRTYPRMRTHLRRIRTVSPTLCTGCMKRQLRRHPKCTTLTEQRTTFHNRMREQTIAFWGCRLCRTRSLLLSPFGFVATQFEFPLLLPVQYHYANTHSPVPTFDTVKHSERGSSIRSESTSCSGSSHGGFDYCAHKECWTPAITPPPPTIPCHDHLPRLLCE